MSVREVQAVTLKHASLKVRNSRYSNIFALLVTIIYRSFKGSSPHYKQVRLCSSTTKVWI